MRSSTKVRQRGRPRKFDSDAAVIAAQHAFARKGYSATTLDDLSAAMGINRPSLYAAFSDKTTLYQQALDAYCIEMSQRFQEALEQEPNFQKALRKLYTSALEAYVTETGEVVGCLITCTAVAEAVMHQPIRQQAKSLIECIDRVVTKRVERAVADGDLPKGTNVSSFARLAVGVLHSLAIRSRAGTSRKVLDELADDAAKLIAAVR